MNIGIDFGGVLSENYNNNLEHVNTKINIPNAIESLIKLKILGNHLFLISYCGEQRAIETKQSIIDNNLENIFDGIYFVKKRKYKKYLCNNLNCHFMIDDNKDILKDVKKLNSKIITILFGKENDWIKTINIINSITYFELSNNKIDILDYCHNIQ